MRNLRALGARLAFAAAALFPGDGSAAPAATQSAALDSTDIDVIEEIESYIDEIDTLHARFRQVSSNGGMAEGEVWMDRPGRIRFEYDPPHPVLMVSNGRTLLYFDRDMQQTTYLPTRETPLWFLLREDVDIRNVEDYHVAGVETAPDAIHVHVVEEGVEPGDPGSIMLTFGKDPVELQRWRIVDQQGITSEITLIEPRYGVEVDSAKFDFGEIDLPRRVGPGRDGTGP